MRVVLSNLALLFGIIGFTGYLLLIIASALGCCAGIATIGFSKILLFILSVAVVILGVCMYNNCCRRSKKEN